MSPEVQPSPASKTFVLQLIGVDVPAERRGSSIRVKQVHWQVAAADYWFIGGLHRSGKSDLLAVAAGITPPLAGKVLLFGADPAESRPGEVISEQLKVGLVFDGGRLLHHLTVAQNVALPLAYHRNFPLDDAVAKVAPLLDWAELQECQDLFPSAISRNWQQRAGLARALALEPELLLVDNPLSGLDPQEARWWLTMLRRLTTGNAIAGAKPITLVITGDTVVPWRDQATQFAILKDGRLHFPGAGPAALKDPLWEAFIPADLQRT